MKSKRISFILIFMLTAMVPVSIVAAAAAVGWRRFCLGRWSDNPFSYGI
ncbi:MAG: hypothetical protein KJP23_02100 [Deltaproteobacteria bacterium]|nr:hypothetical protein [Deltaproteobacteria bacterium]